MRLQSGHATGSPLSASATAPEKREHQQRMSHSKHGITAALPDIKGDITRHKADITATLPDIVMCSLHAPVASTG